MGRRAATVVSAPEKKSLDDFKIAVTESNPAIEPFLIFTGNTGDIGILSAAGASISLNGNALPTHNILYGMVVRFLWLFVVFFLLRSAPPRLRSSWPEISISPVWRLMPFHCSPNTSDIRMPVCRAIRNTFLYGELRIAVSKASCVSLSIAIGDFLSSGGNLRFSAGFLTIISLSHASFNAPVARLASLRNGGISDGVVHQKDNVAEVNCSTLNGQ